MVRILTLVLFFAGGAAAVFAEGGGEDAGAKIRGLVSRLGADDPEVREAAHRELAALGKAAIPFVREALAASDDPEVRRRCEAILREFETTFWGAKLLEAMKNDRGIAERVREGRDPEDYGDFDPEAFAWRGSVRAVEIEGLDDLTEEPVRFFTVDEICFARQGLRWTPSRRIRFAIRENGTGVPVSLGDAVERLRAIFKPVTDAESARRVGIAAARLAAFCSCTEKWRPVEVNPALTLVTREEKGGFVVTIPKEAVAKNEEMKEAAEVRFDAEGRLVSCLQTGEKHMHR